MWGSVYGMTYEELFNINFGLRAEILITLFKCSPQPMLLLFVTVVTVVQRSAKAENAKPRVKPENT